MTRTPQIAPLAGMSPLGITPAPTDDAAALATLDATLDAARVAYYAARDAYAADRLARAAYYAARDGYDGALAAYHAVYAKGAA